jgi:Flp pilus assembly protein TadG
MTSIVALLRRLSRDDRGVSAVEFAFIAPVMILLYFGLAEITQAKIAERRALRTASAVGDILAQRAEIKVTGAGGIDDVFKMAETLMTPFPTGPQQLKICVASIIQSDTGALSVTWSRDKDDETCPDVGPTTEPVPAGLIANGESVVMSRVSYDYVGPTNMVVKVKPTFTKTFYLRPRMSKVVTCVDC